MEITEVRIKLMDDPHERLQAFCSITFDECFVIRDLKIIQGAKGSFVAMPSRKLTDRCPRCHTKNHLRALYCNQCGAKLDEERAARDNDGRAKLYADIAHPINSDCRDLIQRHVLRAYDDELVRSQQPGYTCTYDDYGEDRYARLKDPEEEAALAAACDGRPYFDSSRRIEPAAAHPGPPHHKLSATRGREQSAGAPSREPVRTAHQSARDSDDDEPFGIGIV